MRQIKFRAWDKKSNKMLQQTDDFTFNESGNEADDGWLWNAPGIELMQFTGLLDKNGKEIYESDIVKSKKGSIFIIKFDSGCFWVELVKRSYEDKNSFFGDEFTCASIMFEELECEVIGNIYENPELINQ